MKNRREIKDFEKNNSFEEKKKTLKRKEYFEEKKTEEKMNMLKRKKYLEEKRYNINKIK